jgi:hypothetical protein
MAADEAKMLKCSNKMLRIAKEATGDNLETMKFIDGIRSALVAARAAEDQAQVGLCSFT